MLENGSVAYFSATAKSPHMSRTSMYAPSADFSCFLNCVQNPALKLLPCRKVLGVWIVLLEMGNLLLKIILRSRVFWGEWIFVWCESFAVKTSPKV